MINLKNKKILIIGCSAIGGAAAEILNELGAKVVISDKDELVLDKILSNLDKLSAKPSAKSRVRVNK